MNKLLTASMAVTVIRIRHYYVVAVRAQRSLVGADHVLRLELFVERVRNHVYCVFELLEVADRLADCFCIAYVACCRYRGQGFSTSHLEQEPKTLIHRNCLYESVSDRICDSNCDSD